MSNTGKKKTGKNASTGVRGSSTRKTGSRRTAARESAKQRQENEEKKSFLLKEAGFIFLLFAALFLLIANFGILGNVGAAVSGFMKGLFGYNAYAFPVLLVFFVFYFAKEKHGFLYGFKIFSAVLLFITVCTMLHLAGGSREPQSFAAYYEAGRTAEFGNIPAGGAVGGFIGDALKKVIASAGAWLLMIALFLLSLVVISEKSIVAFARRRAEQASELAQSGTAYAKEKFEEGRIRHEARREAAELKRKEEAMERNLRRKEAVTPSPASDAFDLKKAGAEDLRVYGSQAVSGEREEQRGLPDEFADPVTGTDEICLKTPAAEPDSVPVSDRTPEEPDYDVDEVPFEETREDRYKSYSRILAGGKLDVASAEEMGFAVSRTQETPGRPAAEQKPPEKFPELSAFSEFRQNPSAGTETDPTRKKSEPGTDADHTDYLDDEYAADTVPDYTSVEAEATGRRETGSPAKPADSMPSGLTGYDDFYHITDEQRDSIYNERKAAAARDTAVTSFTADAAEGYHGRKALKTGPAVRERTGSAGRSGNGAGVQDPTAVQHPTPAPQKPVKKRPYQFPPVTLLNKGSRAAVSSQAQNWGNARKLEGVLSNFGVRVTVTNIVKGPRVTRYEMTPDEGVRVSKITSLAGDIKLALAASDLRIEAPIPGKSAVGIEVPNNESATVTFRDIMETEEFKNSRSHLAWGVGLDIQGAPVVGDIAKMPHLLVSGTTGSGKSVGINSIIMSVIYRAKPEDVKLILVDPKVVELSVYDGIPHLLAPVVTKPDKALAVLNKACVEMEERYRLFKESNTRNIVGYNDKIDEINAKLPEGMEKKEKLPYILIIIDELSELMMHSKRDVEAAIVSLTQLARAAGIHLVVATQRPSVDVVTGLIKSNIPSRVAYRLPSGVDSRTILDTFGAETLLGNGDMLYKPGNVNNPIRVQGAYLSDTEVEQVVDWLKKHNSAAYEDEWENVRAPEPAENAASRDEGECADDGRDGYFIEAGILITEKKIASIGLLQRKFKVGFNRASRIMEQLNEAGVVSEGEGTKGRMILMTPEEFRERFGNG